MTKRDHSPLYPRQRRLLELLAALGGTAENTDFQKLLFLRCQELKDEQPYSFVPYRFGAFSFTSYVDRRKLVEFGLLADADAWVLTARGRAEAAETDLDLTAFARKYRGLRGDALVAHTYREHPYFATRSEIAERVLGSDSAALRRIEDAKPRPSASLHTIGYEGHSTDSFLDALLQAGVEVLCDVRRNPISRKAGFSKNSLANSCERVGISYEHLPELGIESDKRRVLESQADYDALFAQYERDWLPHQGPSLRRLHELGSKQRIALMCFEHGPQQCHRHCVAHSLQAKFGAKFAPRHL